MNKIIFFLDDNPKRWTSFISNYFGDFTPIYVKNYKEACEQFLLLLDKDLSDLTVEFRLDHDLCDLEKCRCHKRRHIPLLRSLRTCK